MTSTFKYVYETGLGKFWSILILAHEQAITLGLVVYFMTCYTFVLKANSPLHVANAMDLESKFNIRGEKS